VTPDDLLAELRDLADHQPELLPARVAALTPDEAAAALVRFVFIDAVQRAIDVAVAEPTVPPVADPEAFAAALDDAARVSGALGSIDDLDALLRGVCDALSDAAARLLVFERAFRSLVERAGSGE